MVLNGFYIREIGIPFVMNFSHALASRNRTSSVLLEIHTKDGVQGYGEGAPREYVTGETVNSTIKALKRISNKLYGYKLTQTENILQEIERIESDLSEEQKSNPSAICAIELALLDLYGKMLNKSVLDIWGTQKDRTIFYSMGLPDGPMQKTEKWLQITKLSGLEHIKIKANSDIEICIEKVHLARSVLGNSTKIRIDANGSWQIDEAVKYINRFADIGINIIEQPLPKHKKNNYPDLMNRISNETLIVIDESVCTYDDAVWFIKNKAANGFSLKISKHGGLLATYKIYKLARENGIVCQLGCHVGETSILTQAGRIFASLAEELFAYEGAFGDYLLTHDIVKSPLQFGDKGEYKLHDLKACKGLGVAIDKTLLDQATVKHVKLPIDGQHGCTNQVAITTK